MLLKRLSLLAALLLPAAIQAAPVDKYFGYYGGDYDSSTAANPGGPGFPEMKDHINLYSILAWSGDLSPAGKAISQNHVLGELANAKAAHMHAIVPAYPFVTPDPNIEGGCPSSVDTGPWNSLVSAMVSEGYLIPGDPVHSTVVATYIQDEPNETNCLRDVDDTTPSPTFKAMVGAVKSNPSTATLPVAAILTQKYWNFPVGMQLLDWVGFDHYGESFQDWKNDYSALKAMAPGKKYILVPGAMQGCAQVAIDDTTAFINVMESDPDAVWLSPFAWFSGLDKNPTCKGVRDLPNVRAQYTAEGLKIRNAQCSRSADDRRFCRTDVSAAINYLLDDN